MKLNADFLFEKPQDEKIDFDEKDLIELEPYGLSLTNEAQRPFLLLKDKAGDYTLPVAINQLEAGVALTQSAASALPVTLHRFSESLLESLDIQIERCLFVEIRGVHQYVRLYMSGHPKYQSMKFRADEVMSLCIHLKVPLYATKTFINRSKIMSTEMLGTARGLNLEPFATKKPHTYLM